MQHPIGHFPIGQGQFHHSDERIGIQPSRLQPLGIKPSTGKVQLIIGMQFAREMKADGTPWPLESIYRDAKIGEIYEGANEVQKWVIARKLYGRAITG